MTHHRPLRLLALGSALVCAGGLVACDPKGSTPPTPSTQTGTPKGVLQGDKEALQVREPTTSASGMSTTPNSSADPTPSSGAASAVAPTLPGGGLPQAPTTPPTPSATPTPAAPASR